MESDAEEYSPEDINILKRMMAIFPKVALWIKQEHRLTTWLNLFEQLAIHHMKGNNVKHKCNLHYESYKYMYIICLSKEQRKKLIWQHTNISVNLKLIH